MKIENFSKYDFKTDGSVTNVRTGRVLKNSIVKGYKQYTLICDILMPTKSKLPFRLKYKAVTIKAHQIVYKLYNPNYKLGSGNSIVIDHINGIRDDNRIDNLRSITHRENCSREKTKKSNLPVGVSLNCKGIYIAQISIDKKVKYLGSFKTPEEASEAYKEKLINILNKNE